VASNVFSSWFKERGPLMFYRAIHIDIVAQGPRALSFHNFFA
jgi:hypothetical protein